MKFTTWMAGVVVLMASVAAGQTLRFDEHRERQIPDHANLRLGPFMSDLALSLSAGYRYVTTSGEGRDYLYQNTRGRILKDGSDIPLVAELSMRNYMIISKYVDLDVSFLAGYHSFPMGTEEDFPLFDVIGAGLTARLGSFAYSGGGEGWIGDFNGRTEASTYMRAGQGGLTASISSDFALTPYVRGQLYDVPTYRTEFVDERGYADTASGRKYKAFVNLVGLDMDWLMAKDKNLAYSASRTDTLPQGSEFDVQKSVVYNQNVALQKQLNPVASGGVRANHTWRLYDQVRGDEFQQDYSTFLGAELSENSSMQAALGYSMGELTSANEWETNSTSDAVIGMLRLKSQLSDNLSHQIGYERSQRGGFNGGFEVLDAVHYGISWNNQDWQVAFLTVYRMAEPRLYRSNRYTDWLNQISLAKPLTQYLTLTLATAYTIRDNSAVKTGDAGEGDLLVANSYDTWASNVGLTYAITKRLKASAYVEHLERFSDNNSLAFSRDTAGMTLAYDLDL